MRRQRRGVGLLEMLTFIGTLGAILIILGALMHQMLGLDRAERARQVVAGTVERLGHDLRTDARSATGPVERTASRLVVPGAEGRSIVWLIREADLSRTVNRAGKVEAVEVYARPRGTVARFESPEPEAPNLIALRFDLEAKRPGDPAYLGYRIVAATGRDLALKGATR